MAARKRPTRSTCCGVKTAVTSGRTVGAPAGRTCQGVSTATAAPVASKPDQATGEQPAPVHDRANEVAYAHHEETKAGSVVPSTLRNAALVAASTPASAPFADGTGRGAPRSVTRGAGRRGRRSGCGPVEGHQPVLAVAVGQPHAGQPGRGVGGGDLGAARVEVGVGGQPPARRAGADTVQEGCRDADPGQVEAGVADIVGQALGQPEGDGPGGGGPRRDVGQLVGDHHPSTARTQVAVRQGVDHHPVAARAGAGEGRPDRDSGQLVQALVTGAVQQRGELLLGGGGQQHHPRAPVRSPHRGDTGDTGVRLVAEAAQAGRRVVADDEARGAPDHRHAGQVPHLTCGHTVGVGGDPPAARSQHVGERHRERPWGTVVTRPAGSGPGSARPTPRSRPHGHGPPRAARPVRGRRR